MSPETPQSAIAKDVTVGQSNSTVLPSMRRIVRIDDDHRRMHGYLVHATVNKRRHQIYCSDVRYGGSEKALSVAQSAAAVALSEHDFYLALRRRFNRRQNTPGDIPGVNRLPRRATSDVANYWVARWSDSTGKRHSKKFSVARLTEQGAYELALETRLNATVDDRDILRSLNEATETFRLTAPEEAKTLNVP